MSQGNLPSSLSLSYLPRSFSSFSWECFPNKSLSHESSSRRLFLETVTRERQEAGPEGDGPWLEDDLGLHLLWEAAQPLTWVSL